MEDVLNNDFDNNNNLLPNNNEQNQVNLNDQIDDGELNEDEEFLSNNIVPVFPNRDNVDDVNIISENRIEPNLETSKKFENSSTSSEMDNLIRQDNSQSIPIASSMRKTKKRKRHFNVNKNKKWNKVYKRQKSGNLIKSETEIVSQNTRNKHVYTKVPKITFNSKQSMQRGSGLSKFFLSDKRPRDIIVPPTKFLLGGNISDPLNLNSLQDEALVSMSAVTPKSSPITTPPKVEVIIPPNIYDPLHLLDPVDSIEYEKQLVSPIKNRRFNKLRSKKKKVKKSDDVTDVKDDSEISKASSGQIKSVEIPQEFKETIENQDSLNEKYSVNVEEKYGLNREMLLESNIGSIAGRKRKSSECAGCSLVNCHATGGSNNKKVRRFDTKDKIVSPVIPQPGAWKRPPKVLLGAPRNRIRTTSASGKYSILYTIYFVMFGAEICKAIEDCRDHSFSLATTEIMFR